jgi:hypothetical protein
VGKVLMELTTSLDGYVAGPDISPEAHLGRGGERLHDWMFTGRSADEIDRFETEHFSTIGALILGRRMADLGIGPGAKSPLPRSLLRRHPPTGRHDRQEGRHLLHLRHRRARGRPGPSQGRRRLTGRANHRRRRHRPPVPQRGTERRNPLHVAPLVLGAGTALFEGVRTDLHLAPNEATNTPQVTHLTYAVERTDAAA